jgi:hypothetical protein
MKQRSFIDLGRLDVPGTEDVQHGLTGGEQVIGDEAALAAPPHRLRAHDGAASRAPAVAQSFETAAEGLGHGVVGVIVEAVVLPVPTLQTPASI